MISVVIGSWRARFMTRDRLRDQLVGVVGRGLHRPLAGRVLGGRGVELGGEDAGLDVARQQAGEDLVGAGLELVARRRAVVRRGLGGLGDASSALADAEPPGSSGISVTSTTSWVPAERKRV